MLGAPEQLEQVVRLKIVLTIAQKEKVAEKDWYDEAWEDVRRILDNENDGG